MKSARRDIPGSLTSVTPEGKFAVAKHTPSFEVINLRKQDRQTLLGHSARGAECDNSANFPAGDLDVKQARPIYEIHNAFFFRGATFIDSEWADAKAKDPSAIQLPEQQECSLRKALQDNLKEKDFSGILGDLPMPVLYGLAANSTDPEELVQLADFCCRIEYDGTGQPAGLQFIEDKNGRLQADIDDFELFETIANNPFLPDPFKEIMVLRPGVQGSSEIVGEYEAGGSHVYEYLRSNSYIPWGHYASNLAEDRIRYRTSELCLADMTGLRHLYYQRIFVTLAQRLGIPVPVRRRSLSPEELEKLRREILGAMNGNFEKTATLWGWNFGYDISASGYRLHASHQMIHQQYAMAPETVPLAHGGGSAAAFSCGDLVADTAQRYGAITGSDFFNDLLRALRNNVRTDGGEGENNLVVWEDENVLLFVPKAQVSQWELQLMVTAETAGGPVGNVVEADQRVRESIDRGILTAQRIFAGLGARMVTSIEFPKRLNTRNGQRLLYSFLPKLPWSMGAFSEAQLRFVCGHYPEDFATGCRRQLKKIQIT